jgi:integrase/recombinase XerD
MTAAIIADAGHRCVREGDFSDNEHLSGAAGTLSVMASHQLQPRFAPLVGDVVVRHAEAADLPEDRRSPHVLRHTFCTHLADAGADTAVIRELAGHADIRTTTIYTAVNPSRLENAVAERAQQSRGARRAAAGR